jgi:FkbM family methyltransferase
MKYYSQFGQDKWLFENHFKDKKDGTFLEIGADDGIDKSNTKLFEDLGWTGMCIEPSPKRFKLLEMNRTCVCENYAISDSVGEIEFLDISGWGKGLSGITSKYNDDHLQRIKSEVKHPENEGHEVIKVNTTTIENLLNKHGIQRVNFCSIDTEGCEYDIIKSINFKNVTIDVFLIENNYNNSNVEKHLLNNNYKHIHKLTIDDVYKRY